MEAWTIYLIAGIVVVTFSLLRYNIKRRRREAREYARRRAEAQAAREAEAKKQRELGKPVKITPGSLRSNHPERIPMPDAVPTTFTGSETPRSIARWETEIHEIGRQVMGKIDSKMIALQTLTIEANRAANRAELLLEQLEKIVEQTRATRVEPKLEPLVEPVDEPKAGNGETAQIVSEIAPPPMEPVESKSGNVLRDMDHNVEAEAFADILNDLESELDEYEDVETDASPAMEETAPATILKVETVEEYRKRSSDELSAIRPPSAADRIGNDVLSLNSPGLPGGLSSSTPLSLATLARPALRENLSLNSLYDNDLANREGEAVFAVAAPATSLSPPESSLQRERRTRESVPGSNLDLRKQVEMMADYGYTPRQIAQSLNITVGEVDLMLSLRS